MIERSAQMVRPLLLALLVMLAAPALGSEAVPLPRERPEPATEATAPVPLPRPRPSPSASAPAPAPIEAPEPALPPTPEAPPPAQKPKPPRDYQVACPAVLSGQVTAKPLPPIHEGQCGLQSPLSLEAISANGRSIPLGLPMVTDCGMATALVPWVADLDSYLMAHDKTRLKSITLGTGYQCRNVDNAKTGNLSFHAFADALDLMGFTLEDGRTITVAPGWNGTPEQGSQMLRFAHDAACAHFTTVLGPEADVYHLDNIHLDLACHGKTCTARICQ